MGIEIGLNQLAVASIKNTNGEEANHSFHNGKEAGYIRKKHRSIIRNLAKAKKPKKIKEIDDEDQDI